MKKLNLFIIACAVSFMGFAQLDPNVGVDPTVYAPMGENEMFTLENVWLVSSMYPLENFGTGGNPTAEPPIPPDPNFIFAGTTRNMALRGGIMYFATRQTGEVGLIRVDAATGERLSPISFASFAGAGLFVGADPGFIFQDLRVDCAGNLVVSNMMLSQNARFQVWVLDTANPANSRKVVDDIVRDIWLENLGMEWGGGYINDVYVPEGTIVADPDFPIPTVRIDLIGIYGNMLEDGIILGANASGLNVLKWNVVNGEATWCPFEGFIGISPTQPGIHQPPIDGVPTPIVNLGAAPVAMPISAEHFYLKMVHQPPVFLDMEGNVVSSLMHDFPADGGLNMGRMRNPNGIMEFSLRGDIFLVTSYANWGVGNNSTVRLLRFNDESREFEDIDVMWEFPGIGLGNTNGGGAPIGAISVEVDEVAGTATIAIYSNGNGYGVYVLTSRRPPVSVPGGVDVDALRIFVEGNVVRMNEPAAEITVFSVTGQQVASAVNTNTITIPVSGVFLVRVDGQTQRVIIR